MLLKPTSTICITSCFQGFLSTLFTCLLHFLFTKLKILITTIVPRFLGKIGPGYKAIICFTYYKVIKSVIFWEVPGDQNLWYVMTVKGPRRLAIFEHVSRRNSNLICHNCPTQWSHKCLLIKSWMPHPLSHTYHIAGKFGGQKIWRIVLGVKKIKIWQNLKLANSCWHTFAHTQTRTYFYAFLVT